MLGPLTLRAGMSLGKEIKIYSSLTSSLCPGYSGQ